MKKDDRAEDEREMLDEYDFTIGERGKYSERNAERTNLVRLASDLSTDFPNSESVDKALREYIKIVKKSARKAAS
jgi:hypothetical protein